MADLTDEQIREARALCDAATPDWRAKKRDGADWVYDWTLYMGEHPVVASEPDARFAAVARTLLPVALDSLEEARAELARLRDLLGCAAPVRCASCGEVRDRAVERTHCGGCSLRLDGVDEPSPSLDRSR